MIVTFDREKSCSGHGKGWVELPVLLHYRLVYERSKVSFYACIIPIIFVSVLYIRLSDLRKTQTKDGTLEKNVCSKFKISSTIHYIEKCITLDPGAYDLNQP